MTKFAVVPVTVVPVSVVKPPPEPVKVVPLTVPVMLTPEVKKPEP